MFHRPPKFCGFAVIGNSWVQPRLEHIVRAPSHSTLWGWLAQKCLESSLGEMPVVSKRCRESILFHDQETGAVCEAPALVSHILIPLQCVFEKLACLGDDDDLGRVSKRHDRPCSSLAKTRPIVTEAVQEFGENHLARYDLVGSVIARSCGGLLVEIVARV